jgi:hypothetical protein
MVLKFGQKLYICAAFLYFYFDLYLHLQKTASEIDWRNQFYLSFGPKYKWIEGQHTGQKMLFSFTNRIDPNSASTIN